MVVAAAVVVVVVKTFCKPPGITYSLFLCAQLIFSVFAVAVLPSGYFTLHRGGHISLPLSNNTTTFLTYSCIWIKLL